MSDVKDQEDTGRQDVAAPPVTTERSDTLTVDKERGQRLWLGFSLVGLVMLAVLIFYFVID